MDTFFSKLESRIQTVNSLLCIGLDPHYEDFSDYNEITVKEFCLNLIEATIETAASYKPNAAFFEALGPKGIKILQEIIEAIPSDIPVILDAKRGDIASTARAYARSVFDVLGADAVTVNPYLGKDAIDPFISNPEKGAFLLCKTSNEGAADLQDLQVLDHGRSVELGFPHSKKPLFLHVAQLAQEWNSTNNLGIVVGATQPESLAMVRETAKDIWILAPGVGAQGGNLEAAMEAGLREDGLGMLIPISRAISRSPNPNKAAKELRDVINSHRSSVGHKKSKTVFHHMTKLHSVIADGLLDAGCIKFGKYKLKSGAISPFYIDLRRLAGYPQLLSLVADAYAEILDELDFQHLAALPYAALPIATSISLRTNFPMIYPRKEVKGYGTKSEIEGVYEASEKVVIIDDLVSTGSSKFEGIKKLEDAGLIVENIVVLIDRSPNGGAELTQQGYKLHAVMTIDQLLDYYLKTDKLTTDDVRSVKDFLKGH